MNIHEYQAKSLLKHYNVATLEGGVATDPDEAFAIAETLGGGVVAVKSQIHAGGRGQGTFIESPKGKGGVRIAKDSLHAKASAEDMLGKILVTQQTGAQGRKVEKLYIEAGCAIAREFYLSLLVDRKNSCIMIIASSEGGMDIETIAQNTPEKIIHSAFNPAIGFSNYVARKVAFAIGLTQNEIKLFSDFLYGLYQCFINEDANMIEINPMVLTKHGSIIALDAKMDIDDNALFRHNKTAEMRDETEEEPSELEAKKHDLNYIKLEGEIGCMVNGAGLAMATMDIIKIYGSSPANFLDVGGSATAERVQKAFEIILADPNVKLLLVNIFGGIMRCDTIAKGIINAAKNITLSVPLVVRLEGTAVKEGQKMLADSGLNIITANSLDEAADKSVATLNAAETLQDVN